MVLDEQGIARSSAHDRRCLAAARLVVARRARAREGGQIMSHAAVETIDASGRRELDVSRLKDSGWDSRDPVWWGNTLLIFIETTTIILLVVSYFYVRRNFNDWPPVQSNTPKAIYNPLPDLPIATAELILIAAACLPMYLIDVAARRTNQRQVVIGLWFMFAVTIVAIV